MRLSARRKVDLPQPEGPMTASTVWDWTASDVSLTALFFPNQTLRCCTSTLAGDGPSAAAMGAGAAEEVTGAGFAGEATAVIGHP